MSADHPPTDEPWALYMDGTVAVGVFPEAMPMTGEAFAAVNERWQRLLADETVRGHVAVIEGDEAMSWEILEKAERAAEMGADHDLRRWAIVADGLKQLAVKNHVDLADITVATFEEPAAAIEWAGEA